ncbi:MAG: glycosyltransferase [Bacteroidales bacterium]|nr:glycosyltransferase [Bacteroidales bacterium]
MDADRKHIVFLARWYPHRYDPMFGLFVQRHAEAAALYNDISVVYVHPDNQNGIVDETINNVRTIRVYFKQSKSKIINLLRFFKANNKALKRLCKPDIIHVHILTRLGIIARWQKLVHGIPYIITEHWSRYLPGNDFSGFFRKWATKIVVKHASVVTTVTENLAKAMQNHGLKNPNYMVLPNVVDTNLFQIKPHENATPKIIHISCFEDKSKNISGLLESLKILRDKGIAYQAVLVGDGMDYEAMKQKATFLHLNDNVTFTGMLQGQELVDVLASGDFLVLSSNYENMPVVILEAFACGLPVVSTNVGGISEIVNESNGLLVPPHDAEKLANAMQKMLESYQNYDANTLRDSIIKKFSNEAVGKLLNSLYSTTLSH